jgi:hypothetical protein
VSTVTTGSEEANPGAAAVHPDGTELQTTRLGSGQAGPPVVGAGAVVRSVGTGSVALLWVSNGSTTIEHAEDEAGVGRAR